MAADTDLILRSSERTNEGASLRKIMDESKFFDSSFRSYQRLASRVVAPSKASKALGVVRSWWADDDSLNLHKPYGVMMDSLGVITTELEGLCQSHYDDGVNIRELVKSRYGKVLAMGEVFDELAIAISEHESQHSIIDGEVDGSFREIIEHKMKLRALRMDLYEKKKKHDGLRVQMGQLESSANALEGAHYAHTDVFLSYMMATDAARNMHEELSVLGPNQITSVYLSAGLGMFESHVRSIQGYNDRLKSCVRSRWDSWNGGGVASQVVSERKSLSLLDAARS